MDMNCFDELLEEDETMLDLQQIKGLRRSARETSRKRQQTITAPVLTADTGFADENKFEFTYQASLYEGGWLENALTHFHQEHWITDVTRIIKGGKEASVYLCLADDSTGEAFLAAKVYRPRKFRNLKNDRLYREGREYLDDNGHELHDKRASHAIKKNTGFGNRLKHISWIGHEMQTMKILLEAGADIPVPYASGENAILMSYFGDAYNGAPTLNEISLDTAEASDLLDRVIFNIETMLLQNRIHADLSAYNILYWQGDICLIDFPQAIDPRQNPSAWEIFYRDVTRVCQYFQKQGVRVDDDKLAKDLWTKHKYRTSPLLDPAYLDADDPEDRALWDRSTAGGLGL